MARHNGTVEVSGNDPLSLQHCVNVHVIFRLPSTGR
jgi:hypothetical protein